eukprot:scaffold16335_cov27-Phaeocystis_antarctica.AAC.2
MENPFMSLGVSTWSSSGVVRGPTNGPSLSVCMSGVAVLLIELADREAAGPLCRQCSSPISVTIRVSLI